MLHGLLFLAGGILASLWLFFMLADYGWERKKGRGLNAQARPGTFGLRSERAEYEWYSWARYLAIILLTYINTVGFLDSQSPNTGNLISPIRMVRAVSIAIFFSIVLLVIDSYWDLTRRRGLSGIYASIFWSYFWLRYPSLILVTITATKRGLH